MKSKVAVFVILGASLAMAQLRSDIPENAWKLKVKAVMSADTLAIETDKGMDEVWLVCVRAPQIQNNEPYAVEAREFVISEVRNKDVWIVFDNLKNEPRRNRDGRYMAYVYYDKVVEAGPGSEQTTSFNFLNQELVSRGLARVDLTFPCGKRLELNSLQREARRKRLGIWAGEPE